MIRLLELRREGLEVVEVQVEGDSPCAGRTISDLKLPEGARLISVMRNGQASVAVGATVLGPGDQLLAILQPGKEDELRRALIGAD
jgi:trk system potassium uptake protein TrkA